MTESRPYFSSPAPHGRRRALRVSAPLRESCPSSHEATKTRNACLNLENPVNPVQEVAYDHKGRILRKVLSRRAAEPRSLKDAFPQFRKHLASKLSTLNTTPSIIRETVTDQSQIPNLKSKIHNVWGLDLDGTLQGAGGVGGLLAVVRDDGVYLPTFDANGNVSEYVTTNGAVVAHYDYSPFGETLIQSGDLADAFTHRFSTKPWCPVTHLCEYQMRKYSSSLGRWLSRDPIKQPPQIMRYSFLDNNSISRFDLLGEKWEIQRENGALAVARAKNDSKLSTLNTISSASSTD